MYAFNWIARKIKKTDELIINKYKWRLHKSFVLKRCKLILNFDFICLVGSCFLCVFLKIFWFSVELNGPGPAQPPSYRWSSLFYHDKRIWAPVTRKKDLTSAGLEPATPDLPANLKHVTPPPPPPSQPNSSYSKRSALERLVVFPVKEWIKKINFFML